ncbi:hypothetical protein MHO82_20445 [Vibrio sp. Of7-15]|uniref:tetratricopeptide repeat protein n=1 Tax=Vibrio sp. Of7-15 TaxID=2724879 RepID=UPI001EF31A58|nr:hypothetical protein [Vibrio sp. Of7-15]MCG7499239.1 hypothetical protein [Vibrio sp. Of7-15]
MEIIIVLSMMLFVLMLGLMMTPSPSFESESNSIQTATDLINSGKESEGRSMLAWLAKQGNSEAAIVLAEFNKESADWSMFMLGSDTVPNSKHWTVAEDKFEELLTKNALDGDIEAQERLGEFYYQRPKYDKTKEKALQWFEKAAENDNPSALIKLGSHYYNLHMNEEPNSTSSYASKARTYYERAYHLGELESDYVDMLLKGIGGEANILEAEKILIGLAEEEKYAQFDQLELARHYSEATYLPKDIDKARYWYERALKSSENSSYIQLQYADFLISYSDQDADIIQAKAIVEQYIGEWNVFALSTLAKMHATGQGARKDALAAAMYYELVAKSPYEEHFEARDKALSQLRSYEKRQVQSMVDHYLVKNPIPDEVQAEMDMDFARFIITGGEVSGPDKEDLIRTLKRLAFTGHSLAVKLLPRLYASMNQTFDSLVWQKVALESDTTILGYDKEAEYHFEQQADKLPQEQRQRLEEESKAFIILVKEGTI